jgi:hypothetical protein
MTYHVQCAFLNRYNHTKLLRQYHETDNEGGFKLTTLFIDILCPFLNLN